MLIVVSGLPGTGKSAVAANLVLLTLDDPVEHRRRVEGRSRGFEHFPEPTWEAVRARAAAYAAWEGECLRVDARPALPLVTAAVLDSITPGRS